MRTIEIVIGGMASFGTLYWGWERWRLSKHSGSSKDEFVLCFSPHQVSPEVSAIVYDHFKMMRGIKGFSPAPADSIEGIYGMLGEDLDDELRAILAQLGSEIPHSGIVAEWPTPVETLADVVRLVNWVRTKQNPPVTTE